MKASTPKGFRRIGQTLADLIAKLSIHVQAHVREQEKVCLMKYLTIEAVDDFTVF